MCGNSPKMSALCVTLLSSLSRGSILYAPSSSPTSLERRRSSCRCSNSGKSSSRRSKLLVVNQAVPDGVRYGTFQRLLFSPNGVCVHTHLRLARKRAVFGDDEKNYFTYSDRSREQRAFMCALRCSLRLFHKRFPIQVYLFVSLSLSSPSVLVFILTCRITFTCCVLVLSLFPSKTLSSC